jgi:hypothetical protein
MAYQVKTTSEWLQKVHEHSKDLRQLIEDYHPSALHRGGRLPIGPITAPGAEEACANVREKIKAEEPGDPLVRWDRAMADGDVGEIMSLLNSAWFGVPESTSCWEIPGFGVACDLMDDPPEEPEENTQK